LDELLNDSEASHRVEVTRTYLDLSNPSDANGSVPEPAEPVRIEQVAPCPESFFRYLYAEVGRRYHWTDRLPWTDEEIRRHLDRKEISIWALFSNGSPGGYFELEQHEDGSTEIAYFGLMGHCMGRGLGKYLLTHAINTAWEMKPNRVWLHTCSLDDPAALPNYINRGLRPFKQETYHTFLSPEEMEWYLARSNRPSSS
jgi:GNAT superfamily N-acetyltransferase